MKLAIVAVVVALAACGGGEADRATRATAPPDAAPPLDVGAAIAAAELHSIDEILSRGGRARGAIAVVPIRRGAVRAKDWTAEPCDRRFEHRYFLTRPTGGDDSVRAVPHVSETTPCASAVIRIEHVGSSGFFVRRDDDGATHQTTNVDMIVDAETLAILDVTPRGPAPAPPGVDFTRVVDVRLARRPEGGVTVELPLQIVEDTVVAESTLARVCDTGEHVFFRDEPRDSPLARMSGCRTVRLRTAPDDGFALSDDPALDADLVAIGPPVAP